MTETFRRKIKDFIHAIDFEIGDGSSMEFITFNKEIQEFQMNEDCVGILLKKSQNIAFVLNMGERGIKKQHIFNSILGLDDCNGFQANHPGIYLWTEPIYKPQTDTNIYFLDIQGFGANGIVIEQKLFCMAFLISSLMIYQSIKHIEYETISNFKFLQGMENLVSVKDDSQHSDYSLGEYGPKFIWLLRDLYPGDLTLNGDYCDSETYFEYKIHENSVTNDTPKFEKEKQRNIIKIKQYLLNIFRNIDCFDIVPIEEELSEQLKKRHDEQIYTIRERILSKTNSLRFYGNTLTPRMILTYISDIINKFNLGSKLYLNDAWKTIQKNECFSSYNEAIKFYLDKVKEKFQKVSEPFKIKDLVRMVKDFRDEAFDFYFSCIKMKKYDKGYYEKYFKQLQSYINIKESYIFKINEQLAKSTNQIIFLKHIEQLENGMKNNQFGINNIQSLLDTLQKFYDIYDEISIKPSNTKHFIEFFKEKNRQLLTSYIDKVTSDVHNYDTFDDKNLVNERQSGNMLKDKIREMQEQTTNMEERHSTKKKQLNKLDEEMHNIEQNAAQVDKDIKNKKSENEKMDIFVNDTIKKKEKIDELLQDTVKKDTSCLIF